jgi:hypothetical protein
MEQSIENATNPTPVTQKQQPQVVELPTQLLEKIGGGIAAFLL